jgi:hypothetical protein
MSGEEAEALIAELQRSERELLLQVDELDQVQSDQAGQEFVSHEAIGALKEAWLQAFRVTGSTAAKRNRWTQFKRRICQIEVNDAAMLTSQHDLLLEAIVLQEERQAPREQSRVAMANGKR